MSFFHRFLYDDKSEDAAKDALCKICIKDWKITRICSSLCLDECPSVCKIVDSEANLSPPPLTHQEDNLKRFLIIAASSIITTLFLLTLLVLCFKFYLRRRRSIAITRRWSMEEARNWDVDGPSPVIIDHPIWHIRTIGLNPSVISAIKVCSYNKKDGVVEGTDCSVCLSEFEEDETLRLLPKCRHAFHLSCIDTWLRSHTNCPLCRAPIVIIDDSSEGVEEISVMVPEENGEVERDLEEERDEFVSDLSRDLGEVGNDDDSHKRVRRSVSLDALSGLRVSEVVLGREKDKVKRGNNIGSSIVGRSGFLKRSISYSGK